MPELYLPDLLFADGRSHQDAGLLVGDDGIVLGVASPQNLRDVPVVPLPGKALLPGLANTHSHSFQRLFRARAEGRATGGDTFWTWREQMYRAANSLSPEGVYDVARATFLEMLAAGITVVGEFHYLHNDRDGRPYADPNELAHAVIRAAESVGLRICLLRTAYQRAGFRRNPHPGQRRFYETPDAYLRNLESLLNETRNRDLINIGAAPHSIRAVPLPQLIQIAAFARERNLPLHLHVSEQPAENEACIAEYGQTPIALLAENGVLEPRTTLVHAIHLTQDEFARTAAAGSTICSCPTTERNLGDGIFPADQAAKLEITVVFGTDSQAQIDILEDARQLEYHLRLVHRERGILDGVHERPIAGRLFHSATREGYRALGLPGGNLSPGEPADFFTADLNDLTLLGADSDSLVAQAVFALGRSAIRDVAVAGRFVLRDGEHPLAGEIRSRYRLIQQSFLMEEPQ
jgi:formimidoylglutamate deiminase